MSCTAKHQPVKEKSERRTGLLTLQYQYAKQLVQLYAIHGKSVYQMNNTWITKQMAFNLHLVLGGKHNLYCTKIIVSVTQSSCLLMPFRCRLAFYQYLQDALMPGKICEKNYFTFSTDCHPWHLASSNLRSTKLWCDRHVTDGQINTKYCTKIQEVLRLKLPFAS